jgi:hypothetical protein
MASGCNSPILNWSMIRLQSRTNDVASITPDKATPHHYREDGVDASRRKSHSPGSVRAIDSMIWTITGWLAAQQCVGVSSRLF